MNHFNKNTHYKQAFIKFIGFTLGVNLLMMLPHVIWGQPTTVSPKIPKIPYPTIPKIPAHPYQKNAPFRSKKIRKNHFKCRVKVVLNKHSQTHGYIYLPNTSLVIHINEGDFKYRKTLSFKDIHRIDITQWQGELADRPNKKISAKNRVANYRFYPIQFKIRTRGKKTFIYDGRIPSLEWFKLTNSIGTTQIYSLFYDQWIDTKGWKLSSSKKKLFKRRVGHPLSLKRIHFLSVQPIKKTKNNKQTKSKSN